MQKSADIHRQTDQTILKHLVMSASRFLRGDGAVNEQEYADWTKDFVHYHGAGDPRDNVIPIEIPELSDIYASRSAKFED